MPAALGEALPPAGIRGLDARPAAPLEFSRAWLSKADAVRRRRAELHAAGRLDGVAPPELARLGASLTGELRVPVIAVRYLDVPEPYPVLELANRLFGPSVGDTVSFSDYWREVSGGLLRVDGVVTSWVQLRKPARHYLPGDEYGWGQWGRVGELRRRALEAVDPFIDFAAFDNDGPDGVPDSGDDDGYVDFVAFFYATDCAGDGRAGAIWPHRGAMVPFETDDRTVAGGRIRISDYVILPAQDPKTCGPAHIGVLAHETAHAFGIPDLYDYDGSSRGVGSWGLMGTGSHASPHSPAHPGAWVKEQLGWVRVDWLRLGGAVAVPPVQRSGRVFRYDLEDGSGRYLLLENRSRQGSDRDLPGHGLLAWGIDPERAELGAWNADERRPAVGLLGSTAAGSLVPVDGHDHSGPYPGRPVPTGLRGQLPFRLAALPEGETVMALLLPARPRRWAEAGLRVASVVGGDPVRRRVPLRSGSVGAAWSPRSAAPWLRLTGEGEALTVEVDPHGLAPGRYADVVELVSANGGRVVDRLPVLLEVAAPRTPVVVATELPWSWGLAVVGPDLVQASYGWDALGLRPRPRLLRIREGEAFPESLSRLPTEALYSPTPAPDGGTYVLGHARGRTLLYHVDRSGRARIVTDDLGSEPAYGLTRLPDGSLLVAAFSGRIMRVAPDGAIHTWTHLGRRVYQIAADAGGTVYAALLGGQVARIGEHAPFTLLTTGFDRGRLVAITAAPDGRVFAAERGDAGRIMELTTSGPRLLARVPGGEFYGLAADAMFLYALDLNRRELLRLPIGTAPRVMAAIRPAVPVPPRSEGAP